MISFLTKSKSRQPSSKEGKFYFSAFAETEAVLCRRGSFILDAVPLSLLNIALVKTQPSIVSFVSVFAVFQINKTFV